MKISLRRLALLCAVAGALFAGTASAAVKWSDVFDGNYFSPSADGRGISILLAPQADGSHLFFGALFTYDDTMEPTWLIVFGTFLENQFERADLDVLRFTGGEFSGNFDPATGVSVGTASVRVDSCNQINVNLDMDEASGFPDSNLGNLQPVDGPSEQCVYRRLFTACPAFSQAAPGIDRACVLNGVYTQNITLTNEITWILNGLVRIGNDNANSATVTIEPGTVIIGAGESSDYLYVSPGSRINAHGKPWAPIVMTSANDGFSEAFNSPEPGDVGGLVLSGNAPANACADAPYNCFSEFDESLRFGGNDPHDSCGELSYWQVRYAGFVFAPNREVNSYTMQACGDGTIAHHLQAYRGQDDGIEFFGGTARVKYFVVTEGGDDAVDWDFGFSGGLQYGLVYHGEGFGEDFGIEGASNPDGFDLLPRATPTVANFTFLGNGNGDAGILFKEGSGGRIYNTIVDGFADGCLEWANAPSTYNAAGTPEAPNTDVAAYNGVILNCAEVFLDGDGAPYTLEAFFNSASFSNNQVAAPGLDGIFPSPGGPASQGGVVVEGDSWFDSTSYRGGFNTDNWMEGWTHRPMGN